MPDQSAVRFDDVGECVDAAMRRVGNKIVLAIPLGMGKPIAFVNELYRRVARDPSVDLTILTALSLNRPTGRSDLDKRLMGPMAERIWGDYPDLDYIKAAKEKRLPANIRIREFFVQAGAWLNVASTQQEYLSSNYSHVVRDAIAMGVNMLAQGISARGLGLREQFSLSGNPDLSLDLLDYFEALSANGAAVVSVGSVNRRLPFMLGGAALNRPRFDLILDHERYEHDPFCIPNAAIGDVEHALGLNAAALVRDGGTLQLGIGELGEAIVYALQLRQQRNDVYRHVLDSTGVANRFGETIQSIGGLGTLDHGIFANTEMFVDGFLELYRSGILSRRVYPHAVLQRLLDDRVVTERPDLEMLVALSRSGVRLIDHREFLALERCGLFAPGTTHDGKYTVISPFGRRIEADLASEEARATLASECLSLRLEGGHVLHGGFMLGPRAFYSALRNLPEADRVAFNMTSVTWTNEPGGPDHALKVAQRRDARFINTTMMVTGLGAAVSDALESGQVVSGVGGQFNFVSQAHALPGARSILLVRSTRTVNGKTVSNIVWNYGHTTVPRHMRDVVVTEYGVAALRGLTDRDCVVSLLAVTDSRFQDDLLAQAKSAGKIEPSYVIPEVHRKNLPETIAAALRPLRREGFFSTFPFGCDYTAEELVLQKALSKVTAASGQITSTLSNLLPTKSLVSDPKIRPYLERLGFEAPKDRQEKQLQQLIASAVADVLAEH
jgi:acyl-CoA hydrolase